VSEPKAVGLFVCLFVCAQDFYAKLGLFTERVLMGLAVGLSGLNILSGPTAMHKALRFG
jgi:hypothetical protein